MALRRSNTESSTTEREITALRARRGDPTHWVTRCAAPPAAHKGAILQSESSSLARSEFGSLNNKIRLRRRAALARTIRPLLSSVLV
jgi:hypothetical protein